MEYRILGPLEVLDGDRPVALGTAKERALLAVLLLHANEAVSRDRLIDELWGERPPATAAKAVQVYVSQLRKALAVNGGAIATRTDGYVLEVDTDRFDSARFEQLVAEANSCASQDPEAAVRLLRLGLGLWRGKALAGLRFESHSAGQVERLEELRLAARTAAIDLDLALGRHADVIGELEELVAEHPLKERLRSQLMLALYRSGRQADALRVYRDARETLVETLGIEPGLSLQRLEREILTHDPALELPAARPSGSPESAPEREPPAPPLRIEAPRLWRRRFVGALVAALLVAIIGVALVLTRSAETSPLSPLQALAPDSVAVIDPETNVAYAQIPVGGRPAGIAVGEGAVWVGNSSEHTLLRIDPVRRRVARRIGLGVKPSLVAVGAGSVWVASDESNVLLRIDPLFNRVRNTIDLDRARGRVALPPPVDVAVGGGAVWVAHGVGAAVSCSAIVCGDVVSRVSVRSAAATARIRVSSTNKVAFGDGALWSLSGPDGRNEPIGSLARIDPGTNALAWATRMPRVGRVIAPVGLAVGEGAIWVIKHKIRMTDGALFEFDPATGRLATVLRIADNPWDVTAGADAVWILTKHGTVVRVDPATSTVVRSIPLGRAPRTAYPEEIAVGEGAVWVTMR